MSVTLTELRRRLADELGGYGLVTATSTSTGADAASKVVAAEWTDSEFANSLGHGAYLYGVSGNPSGNVGQQRRVTVEGVDASAGILRTASPFSAAPQTGQVFELHTTAPPKRYFHIPGLQDFLNQGLRCIPARNRRTMTGTAATPSYALSAFGWLGEYGRVLAVLENPGSTWNPVPTSKPWRVRYDVEAPVLEIAGFGEGQTFFVDVQRQGDTRIKRAGVWSDVTDGLQNDSDETFIEASVVVQFALWKAYDQFRKTARTSDERKKYTELYQEARDAAAGLKQARLGMLQRELQPAPHSTAWAKSWSP